MLCTLIHGSSRTSFHLESWGVCAAVGTALAKLVNHNFIVQCGKKIHSNLSCAFKSNSVTVFTFLGKPISEESKKGRIIIPDIPPPRRVVAFTAKLNVAHSTPYHSGVLKLVDVLVNEGDAYSPDTGVFTCPLDGLYHFSVHMSVCGRAQCAIYKNGESLASLYHTSLPNGCSQVASISSTVQLCEGDRVWLNLWGHGRHEIIATQDNDTVFVGFYLG